MQRWVIFCKVIDNWGDIGVSWRLARQLAHEYPCAVDLWLDDLAASEADSYAQVVAGIVGPHRDPGAVRVRPMA